MAKRDICVDCARPKMVCLCSAFHCISSQVQLIIWQDPTEAKHKLSTVPLLQRSIRNTVVLVGNAFHYDDVFGQTALQEVALLYPLEHKDALPKEQFHTIKKLLVLDGTWRKVRKLLLANNWLTELPHIRLAVTNKSRYYIRTSPRDDGVSTIEAAIFALNQLEETERFTVCLNALDAMVLQQQQFGHKQ